MLTRADRRLLGVGRYPGRRMRRGLLADARAGRAVDPELCRQTHAWADYALGEQHRRRWLMGVAALALFALVLLIVGLLTGAPVYGGVGAGVGSIIGSCLSRFTEREEARDVKSRLPEPSADEL